MTDRKSLGSLLIFVGTILCFFLPFVTVSCGGIKAFTLTGQQLATGTTLTDPQAFGPPRTQMIHGDPFAALAAMCAILGVVLSLVGRSISGVTAVSGGAGAASMFIMRTRLDSQIQQQGQGLATVKYELGYTLVILLFIIAAAWNIYLVVESRRTVVADGMAEEVEVAVGAARGSPPHFEELAGNSNSSSQSAYGPTGIQSHRCDHCGRSIRPSARYCEGCGNPLQASAGSATPGVTARGGQT